METAETNATLTEQELVEQWRASELERAGYPPTSPPSSRRAPTSTCTCAAELLQRGCYARARRLDPALAGERADRLGCAESGWTSVPPVLVFIPSPAHRRRRRRPAAAPHVRADAARRDPRVRLADRPPLEGAWAATGTSSRASPSGASPSASSARGSTTTSPRGTRCRRRSGRAIFEVWKGGLGVWGGILSARSSGAIVVRRAGRERRAVHGRGRAGPAARAGHRPDRQLVEPGALRQADRPAVGARRSTPRTGRSQYLDRATFHPTFLYELIWDFVGVALLLYARPALHDPAAGALRALRRLVLLRPLLRGAAADRPVAPHRRACA